MSAYVCDGCEVQIAPQNPRFHCQACPSYDSCANCHARQHTIGNHQRSHGSVLVAQSGLRGQIQQGGNYQQFGGGQQYQHQAYPYQQQQAQPVTPHGNGWTPLYNGDNSPSRVFITVIEQLFACLDLYRTGTISPEAYSSFLDAQGYPPHMNTWKHAYNTAHSNRESVADNLLKTAYETLGLDHHLQRRQVLVPTPQAQQRGGFLSSFLRGGMTNNFIDAFTPAPSPMPLLTLHGFITGLSLDILVDPEMGWTYLNRALRYYQIPIWREKGDIPRAMVPLVTPPAVQAMMARIQQNATEAARMNAEIQRRGNEIAVSAIGGGRWEYR